MQYFATKIAPENNLAPYIIKIIMANRYASSSSTSLVFSTDSRMRLSRTRKRIVGMDAIIKHNNIHLTGS